MLIQLSNYVYIARFLQINAKLDHIVPWSLHTFGKL